MSKHYERQANQSPVKYVTFHDSEKHLFQPLQSYLFILLLSSGFSKFVLHLLHFYVHATLYPLVLFFFLEFSLSAENMRHYLWFLKTFPCFILTGGKIEVLPESSLIFACVSASQRSAHRQKNDVHARAHLLCFLVVPFVLWFYPFLGMGTPSTQVVFINYLSFRILNDEVRS